MKLVEIVPPIFDIALDIRYATDNNFTGKAVYSRPGCYLHPEAAKALTKAIAIASTQGLRFLIFDAFRPLEVQQALWEHTPDPEFLSDPSGGSCPHCRGVAIDLTLIDQEDLPIEMGTEFDEFTPLSHHGNTDVAPTAQQNRELLKTIMMDAGWDFYKNEWWHYQLFNCRDYPLLTDKIASTNMLFN